MQSVSSKIVPKVSVLILIICLLTIGIAEAEIPIIISENAAKTESLAADELQHYLSRIYPSESFAVSKGGLRSTAGRSIRLGTIKSQPELKKYLTDKSLCGPESYVVTKCVIDGIQTGIVLGADNAGVIYGVYGLLEKLGCGFYLTTDILPVPGNKPFDFNGWDIADHPLVSTRLVFNWHNFLSGCTGWNYEHWQQWISNSQKMGFNTVMVHAYGNNPMFTYTFNGKAKPTGYYGTSRRGRDWGRQHINDVRRLPGGEIFDGPEFGADAATVPDDKRIEAAQQLMKRVFSHAEKRGVRVCFAIDVDTISVLDQDMILSLPEYARFHNGSVWLPRCDTEDGYGFYKAQVDGLLELYPQIDILALWRRVHGQEWGRLKNVSQLPKAWQVEYEAHIRENPEAAKLTQAVCSFALNKVVGAFRRALDEAGRTDVQISMGSWETAWVPVLAEFLPDEVTLMPLDSSYLRYRRGSFLKLPKAFADIKRAGGRIIPIIWAHHDDGEYIGRPIHSHTDFNDTLSKLQSRGYGIIHWMTRPLDLYFKNHENQVWAETKNEPYTETCRKAGVHWFGAENGEKLGRYLQNWWTNAPIFGRVTTNYFFPKGQTIPKPEQMILQCRERIETLARINSSTMSKEQKERVAYFHELEKNLISFCKVQELAYQPAFKAIKAGDFSKARSILRQTDPAETIRQFSRLSQMDGGNRGEEAMVFSLGTRWITDYLAARQAVGLEAVRINYGPTSFEPLAQSAGSYTFHIDSEGEYWSVRGAREARLPVTMHNEDMSVHLQDGVSRSIEEIARTGIVVDSPTTLTISPIVNLHKQLAPGDYNLTIYAGAAPGEEQCTARFWTKPSSSVKGSANPTKGRSGSNNVQGKTCVLKNSRQSDVTVRVIEKEIHLAKPALPQLCIMPEEGTVVVYGLTLKATSAK